MSLVAGCAIGIFSCSDDNDYKATPLSTIEVLSASTSLIAGQDTGWVKTNCNVAAAYVDAEDRSWIDVTVKGDSVKFFTKQNESTESRNTMLVIKKSDNDSVKVNITQRGMIFIVQKKVNIVQFTDDAKSYYYNINTDYVGKVVETPSWIEANFTDSRLNINVAENNEGHIREGYVKYSCGNFSDSICVTQYEFAKDILGEYELWVGYNEETDVMEKKVPATLSTNVSSSIQEPEDKCSDASNIRPRQRERQDTERSESGKLQEQEEHLDPLLFDLHISERRIPPCRRERQRHPILQHKRYDKRQDDIRQQERHIRQV